MIKGKNIGYDVTIGYEELKKYRKSNYWRGFRVGLAVGFILLVIATEVYIHLLTIVAK